MPLSATKCVLSLYHHRYIHLTQREPPTLASIIDTLEIAKELHAADFTERQPEAVAGILRKRAEADASGLASKTDLDTLYWKIMVGVAVLLLANLGAV